MRVVHNIINGIDPEYLVLDNNDKLIASLYHNAWGEISVIPNNNISSKYSAFDLDDALDYCKEIIKVNNNE